MAQIAVNNVFGPPTGLRGGGGLLGGGFALPSIKWPDIKCPQSPNPNWNQFSGLFEDDPTTQDPFYNPLIWLICNPDSSGSSTGPGDFNIDDNVPDTSVIEFCAAYNASASTRDNVITRLKARGVTITADPASKCVQAGTAVRLTPRASRGKALDADANAIGSNGTPIQLWDAGAQSNQKWTIELRSDSFFTIRCSASGRVLDAAADDVNNNGCRVQLWDDLGGINQQWLLHVLNPTGGAGLYQFVNRASGKVLDADAFNVYGNGCRIQLWQQNNGDNQIWVFP
jgi:hypothetical protein